MGWGGVKVKKMEVQSAECTTHGARPIMILRRRQCYSLVYSVSASQEITVPGTPRR